MDPQILRKLLAFIKEVKQMAPDTGPVLIRAGAKPFEMTFFEYVVLWYDKTIDVIKEEELPPAYDPIGVLRTEHEAQVLRAVLQGSVVPPAVLREYRYNHQFFKPIRKYCRTHKIDLDA